MEKKKSLKISLEVALTLILLLSIIIILVGTSLYYKGVAIKEGKSVATSTSTVVKK